MMRVPTILMLGLCLGLSCLRPSTCAQNAMTVEVNEYDEEYYYEEYEDDESMPSELHISQKDREEAETLHSKALQSAESGDLEGALPFFKLATKRNPAKDMYWSNLGVTQMRLNLLDEAKQSLLAGQRVNPMSTLIEDNLAALEEHLEFRRTGRVPEKKKQKQRQKKKVAGASPLKRKQKLGTPKPLVELPSELDPSLWFGEWWSDREALDAMLKEALEDFRPVQIRHFLKPEIAESLHSELYHSPHFKVYQDFHRWYQFHFRAIYEQDGKIDQHPTMHALTAVMGTEEVKGWVQSITGFDVSGSTIAGASHYAPGDYTMPHTDRAAGRPGDEEKRRVAYILHMTREWNPKFGGDLVFMSPTYHVHPSFNCLTLIPISQASWHFISPVAHNTPPELKRLAFSGWFTTRDLEKAEEIEKQRTQDHMRPNFALIVDGVTGQKIPYPQAYDSTDGLWERIVD